MAAAFDFIVVGAGSAGCVLANRLTADGSARVLLLEAGPRDTNPWIHIPVGYGKLFARRSVNWCFESEPEPQLNGRRIFSPAGRVLGGSSSISGLLYVRGQREDYDRWQIPGWTFADLLPYFRRAEDQQRGENDWHGVGGPLAVSDPTERHVLADAFIAACHSRGIPLNDDFNAGRQEGAGYYQATTRNGRRCSASVAYLRPAAYRRNLRVETDTLVTRLLFDGHRAVGVEYTRGGRHRTARAAGEIIVACGTFNSPRLLQLSGIGPRALLQRHGIRVLVDAPEVGENLQDHFYARMLWRCTKRLTLNDDIASPWRTLVAGARYAFQRKGPLTIAAGLAGAFARTTDGVERPDIQFYFINFSITRRGGPLHPFSGFTCSASQLQPESRGWVRLRSSSPLDAPLIQYNYLSTDADRQVMIRGLRLLHDVANTDPLRQFVAAEEHPCLQMPTDADWLTFCRTSGETVFHPTSTCRMGLDERSVVDSELRVRGVSGLRVVDASVMPSVISGNTNAPTIAIAERAADLILR